MSELFQVQIISYKYQVVKVPSSLVAHIIGNEEEAHIK